MEGTFVHICKLLVSHGVVPSEIHDAEEEWNKYSLQQQRVIYRSIRDKIRAGKFVNYHPVLAIRDNAPKAKLKAPHNYRGEIIPSGLQVFSAAYNGVYGMYTQADIDAYGLTLPEDQ